MKSRGRRYRGVLGIIGLVLCSAWQVAHGFELVPMEMDFAPAGRGANQAFVVKNDSSKPVPAQVTMLQRKVDVNGKETNSPADDEFFVFPPQFIVPPHKSQTIRVRWLGPARPKHELAFRIMAEQLPVTLSPAQAKANGKQVAVQLLLRYLGSVYVVPPGAKSDLRLESVKRTKGPKGAPKLALLFHNRGNAHGFVPKLDLALTAGGKTVTLSPKQLKGVVNENILAGNRRRFLIPYPDGLPAGEIHVQVTLVPLR